MTQLTTRQHDVVEPAEENGEEPATDLLVEEVSIDGLCGVY